MSKDVRSRRVAFSNACPGRRAPRSESSRRRLYIRRIPITVVRRVTSNGVRRLGNPVNATTRRTLTFIPISVKIRFDDDRPTGIVSFTRNINHGGPLKGAYVTPAPPPPHPLLSHRRHSRSRPLKSARRDRRRPGLWSLYHIIVIVRRPSVTEHRGSLLPARVDCACAYRWRTPTGTHTGPLTATAV